MSLVVRLEGARRGSAQGSQWLSDALGASQGWPKDGRTYARDFILGTILGILVRATYNGWQDYACFRGKTFVFQVSNEFSPKIARN